MLKPERRRRRRRRFATYDLEWHPSTLELRLIGAYDGRHYRSWERVDEFLASILTPQSHGRWYYAHAGGSYDLMFLLDTLIDKGYRLSGAFSGSAIIILRVEQGEYHWTFLDSAWLLRAPLKKIGEALGYVWKDPDVFTAPIAELREYNRLDCKILWEAIAQFEDELWTMGSQLERSEERRVGKEWRCRWSRDH